MSSWVVKPPSSFCFCFFVSILNCIYGTGHIILDEHLFSARTWILNESLPGREKWAEAGSCSSSQSVSSSCSPSRPRAFCSPSVCCDGESVAPSLTSSGAVTERGALSSLHAEPVPVSAIKALCPWIPFTLTICSSLLFLWHFVVCQTLDSIHFARMRLRTQEVLCPQTSGRGTGSAPTPKPRPPSTSSPPPQALSCSHRPSDALGAPAFKSQSSF